MDFRALSKLELSEILDKSIETVHSGGDWYAVFPEVTGYKYFVPEGYEDLEEYPNAFRGVDHAIAHKTVVHPDLHPKITELLDLIAIRNVFGDEVFLADMYDHAGAGYAVELALFEKQYVKRYADFISTNDVYYEKFQHFDFVRIVRRWAWCSETYYLMFAHMFFQSEYFHDDMDHFNYNGYPLHKGLLDDQEEVDTFLDSLSFFLKEIAYNTEDEALNTAAAEMFGELVRRHIFPDYRIFPEEKEKAEKLGNRYHEVVEKLLHVEVVSESSEETNTTVDVFQQYEDDDIAEI